MIAKLKVDPERRIGIIDRNIFGGFAEHVGRCIYGGMFEEGSRLSDESGFRLDVIDALKRLRMPLIRYPGGNFVSGYRWRDGVGPRDKRTPRLELAWHSVESNRFGTDEFVAWCRKFGTEPYMVVNCGDGDQREARDWVEYCNGTEATEPVLRRRANGYDAPYGIKYWGIGNEVFGNWQIGYKTPQEYARVCREFGKAMKWVDPSIKIVASTFGDAGCRDWKERGALVLEQAAPEIDYLSMHWYVGNRENDFAKYMTVSEQVDDWLTAYEGLITANTLDLKLDKKIGISVDEWNVWYRTGIDQNLEDIYNLEDALVVAMQISSFIRHCRMVTMANIAQIVNVIGPVLTSPDGLFLQTIFYPFEVMSREAGPISLDLSTICDTFEGGNRTGCPVLDVSGTFDPETKQVSLFVVNRTMDGIEAEIDLQGVLPAQNGRAYVINGPNIKSENSFEHPDVVITKESSFEPSKGFEFEPHSFTALCFEIK